MPSRRMLREPRVRTILPALVATLVAGLTVVGHDAAAAATKTVVIKNLDFAPAKISIDVGDTVVWKNKETDGTQHHVEFDDGPQSRDLNPGDSWARHFTKKGTYHYICSIHTYMEGKVVVGGSKKPVGAQPGPSSSPSPSPSPSASSTSPTDVLPTLPSLPELPPNPSLDDGQAHDLGDGTSTAPYTVVNGVKVFRLHMFTTPWEVTRGHFRTAWTFNGTVPGPVIRVNEGDKVKILVKNDLPEATAVHWHGMELPNDQDGVPGVTQKAIKPGASYTYQWTALVPGTHWYHSHMGGNQVGHGLYGQLEVVPRTGDFVSDRDYRLMISDGALGLTFNGHSYPDTHPLVAKVGERVRIRLTGTGPELMHPIHIHGQPFEVVAQDGMPLQVPQKMDTLIVGVGQTYDIIVVPRRPGKWLVHCHIFSHSEGPHGMAGLVTYLDVKPSNTGYVPLPY